jgi:predicted DNA-binding protein YlxM (UPF0122 family)
MKENLLDKKTRFNVLFDFYGKLLTEKQQQFIQLYYHDDYSLAEISENFQISRQAVNEHLKRAEELLEQYESNLHLLDKHSIRLQIYQRINICLDVLQDDVSSEIKYYMDLLKKNEE